MQTMTIQPTETGFLPLPGGSVYYETFGAGEPLLLLHGSNLDTRMWDFNTEELASHYRVIRMDLRPFGQSPASTAPFAVHEDIAALLDHLGIEKAHLIGHSLGGYLSLEFALAHPDRVRSLILACTALFGHPRSEALTAAGARFMELHAAGDYEAFIDNDLRSLFDGPHGTREIAPDVLQKTRAIRDFAFAKTEEGVRPAFLDPAPITRLEEIAVPVLTTYGDREYTDFQEISNVIAQRVPKAEQAVQKNTGHLGCMEQPSEFNALVLNFLSKNR